MSFSHCSGSTHPGPATVLGAEDTGVNKPDSCLEGVHSSMRKVSVESGIPGSVRFCAEGLLSCFGNTEGIVSAEMLLVGERKSQGEQGSDTQRSAL